MAETRRSGDASPPPGDDPSFALAVPLPTDLLYRRCAPDHLPFDLCTELADAPGLIGQERATEAVRFAVRMRRKGYNIFALGDRGAGRQQLIEDLLRHQAETEPTPPDWCYVNNFADPQQPRCLSLPAGRGAAFEAAMKRLVEELRATLPAAFERDDNRARQQVVEQRFKERSEQALGALQQHAEGKGIALLRTPMGLALAPRRDGRVVSPEDYAALSADQREQTQREIEGMQGELEALMRQVPLWEREHRDALRALTRDTAAFAIGHLLEDLRNGYRDLPAVIDYLDAVERDIKENVDYIL